MSQKTERNEKINEAKNGKKWKDKWVKKNGKKWKDKWVKKQKEMKG